MSLPSVDLKGETAVVTGTQGKLGGIWVDALRAAGADVVGLDTAIAPGRARVTDTGPGGRYLGLHADVTDRGSLRAALRTCVELMGRPTVLVNNAGIDQPPAIVGGWSFADIPDEVSAGIVDVNALGTLRVCQVFGDAMVRAGRGSVVNIGSMYGTVAPDPRMYDHLPTERPFLKPPAYGISKAGVAALTRYLAVLWGPDGVRVNTLSPGGVAGAQDPTFRDKFTQRVPLRRMAVTEDLTGPLLFLASDASSYVTGQELLVDGGFTCL